MKTEEFLAICLMRGENYAYCKKCGVRTIAEYEECCESERIGDMYYTNGKLEIRKRKRGDTGWHIIYPEDRSVV